MFINPPLRERTDKELYDIISNDEKWSEEAEKEALSELNERGIPMELIQENRRHRKDILERYRLRVHKLREANALQSYNAAEMIVIVVGLPVLLLSKNLMNEFSRLEKYNYKTKVWQRSTLIFVSILFWAIIITRLS